MKTCCDRCQNILGVLAGLNRVYYSTFQFKRMRTFIEGLAIKPDNLHERLEAMITSEPAEAIRVMEGAVRDTVELVDEHMPELDTSRSHRYLEWKVEPWSPFELDEGDRNPYAAGQAESSTLWETWVR